MNPFTGLYTATTAVRNVLFDRGVFVARKLRRPVVSVGNLSIGGTGKTPFVIALGELLKERGVSFDVLSRGYRRRTRGVLVVEPDGSAADFGDEPLLIARRLGVPVIVGESRYMAGHVAEAQFNSELHILDDGFQHRRLSRDFDIVLMTGRDFGDKLLPSGRLREPLSSLKRADAIVLPAEVAADSLALKGNVVWRFRRQLVLPTIAKTPVVFCGIARPDQFFAQVRGVGFTPAAEVSFRDHHAYGRRDVERLVAKKEEVGADGFVTTEKDAVNLGPLQSELRPLAIARLTMTFEESAGVVDTILETIRNRKLRT